MEQLRNRFLHPAAEFSPMPFWFLNGDLEEAELRRQLVDFADKGIHGIILHPRIGIPKEIGYLSDRFMALIRYAADTAAELGMLVILYDEGMYPSGSANGQVVRENPTYASRGIFLREEADALPLTDGQRLVARIALEKTGDAAYRHGSARLLGDDAPVASSEAIVQIVEDYTGGTIRGIHAGEDDGEPNAPKSGDLLSTEAMQCFIRLTHDRYYEALSDLFGTTVIAMFTDEPNPVGRNAKAGLRAWTWGLEADWLSQGLRLEDLPALFWDAGEASEAIRDAFEQFITNRMIRTYYQPLSDWCEAHRIVLTGHPAEADSIALERIFGIPGQDVVWRFVAPENRLGLEGRESTQAKCASDSARHFGKRRNSNECFGCCGPDGQQWALTLDDIKWYLDWLFVRGTNLIYPHAFFYATDTPLRWGERPPDVGPNNYWWPYMKALSTYISRMCAMLTDGINQARAAILCSGVELPWRIAAQLFERQIEFNYLEGDLLVSATIEAGQIRMAQQAYDVIAIEDGKYMTSEASEALARFTAEGGKVFRLGETGCETAEALADSIAAAGLRTVILSPSTATIRATHLQHGRQSIFLLTNEGDEDWQGQVALPVAGACERWDAWTGRMEPQGNSSMPLPLHLPPRKSVFYIVNPEADAASITPEPLPSHRAIPADITWTAITPDGKRYLLQALGDWQQWEGMALFSGTVAYEGSFVLDSIPEKAMLDLGDVREMATVSLNGGPPTPLLLRPFTLDITGQLQQGENRLRVEVTSSRVSFFERIPWPSGLLGPVKLSEIITA